jgi:uncharacterized repeat protein (TIGR03803 family)
MNMPIRILLLLPALVTLLGLMLADQASAQTYTNVHVFNYPSDGAKPQAGLILSGNTLYGTTSGGGGEWGYGTVFKVDTDGSYPTNFYTFKAVSEPDFPHTNSDGAYPQAGLVLSGNSVYGTTGSGGAAGNGTVFRVNTDGSSFTNLHNFTAVGFNGINGDGASPLAGLVLSGNSLYGTASSGGTNGEGTVFAINTDGTGFRNLYSFTTTDPTTGTNSDGSFPSAGLILSGSILYGTTVGGGAYGNGTIFAINTNGSDFTNLYSFTAGALDENGNLTNSDGANPQAGLILAGNTLYGTASGGGLAANGTVFAVSTDGTGFTNLYSFSDNGGNFGPNGDGADPIAGLFLSGYTLYGTANQGGASANGTVFAININGTGFTNLFNFNGYVNNIGALPSAGVILSGDTLYGTTLAGGYQYGTVFGLTIALPGQQGINSATIIKTAVYAQTNAAPPVAVDPSGPYYFAVQYFADNTNVITDGVTFITPSNLIYSFDASYVNYFDYNSDYFYTKTAMDDAFPDGVYLLSINQNNVYSQQTLPVNELYSTSIPAFSPVTWTNLQLLDPGRDITLHWNNFTPSPGVTSAFVFIRILDSSFNYVFLDSFLPSGTTSDVIPAHTLNFGGAYRLEVLFSDRYDALHAGFGGEAELTSGFENLTYAYFTARPLNLNIAPAGANLVFSWTNSASDYSLQYTHNLASGVWNLVTNATVTIGNQIVLTNSLSGTNTFFRLEKSQ